MARVGDVSDAELAMRVDRLEGDLIRLATILDQLSTPRQLRRPVACGS